jgi:hypothetical protein
MRRRSSIGWTLGFFAAALLPACARAQVQTEVSGYLKDYNLWTQTFLQSENVNSDLGRARLQLDSRDGDWSVHVIYDQEVLSGSLLQSEEVRIFGLNPPKSLLDLDWTTAQGPDYIYRNILYRAYVENVSDPWTVRVGRQRINWGTGKIWQPTDILNPYQPLSIEPDYRWGVDAVYLRRAIGSFDQIELAYAPLDTWSDSSLLARLHQYFDIADLDFSMMGGKTTGGDGATIVGGDLSGTMGKGLGYAEWSYTNNDTAIYWRYLVGYIIQLEDAPFDWLVGSKVITEYYHNGDGAVDPLHYNYAALLSGTDPWPARDAMGVVYSKNLHPLLRMDGTVLWDLNDGELYGILSFTWDATKDFQLTVGGQTVNGSTLNELGFTGRVGYVQGQYFFGSKGGY